MSDRLLTIDELIIELEKYSYKELHVHHTWLPNHSHFNGSNHQRVQDGMRNHHVNTNKWVDIGQHVSLFPDGKFLTGRDFSRTPASITGFNTGAFCVEMVGDFDIGKDKFEGKQKEAMIKLARYFHDKKRYIRFHNENSGKTCPGTSIKKEDFMKEVIHMKKTRFSDVAENRWSYQAIEELAKSGIISGYADGTFKPTQSMTREEVASLLYRALSHK